MLKSQLEEELEKERKAHNEFKEKIVEGLKEVLENSCYEGYEKVKMFCDTVGIKVPTRKMLIEVPYGVNDIGSMTDGDWDDIEEFSVIDKDFKE